MYKIILILKELISFHTRTLSLFIVYLVVIV